MKIPDILANPDKLREVIKESLGILKGRQAELDSISKPISEKLVDITDKKARLADQWVITNMDPSRLAELESINATLQYWQNQFQPSTMETESNGQGVQILEKTRPTIKIYGFEDIEPIENITSITAKREIMDRLQVHMVVFNDRIEIRCQIPIEQDKSIKVILNLVLPSTSKRQIKIKHPIL